MGFGKRKVPVTAPQGHPLAGEMPLGQLPLEDPKPKPVEPPSNVESRSDETPRLPDEPPIDADHFMLREGDAPPQRRIIPASIWEGKNGDMLRELGFNPDDASNLVPDAQSVNERLERDKAAYEKRLEETNRKLQERFPDARMRGFSLIPDPCWNGPMGKFLTMQLELFPFEDWNLVLLPTDMKTAAELDLPPHPGSDLPAFVDTADRFLREAQMALHAAHDEAGETHDFNHYDDAREEIREKVRGLARNFLGKLDAAWETRAD